MNVLWQPNPGPQTAFSKSTADYVLYGGARGGGKTDALLAEATRFGHFEDYKGLFLRRTFPQLSEVMERANKLYPKLGWKWEGEKRMWRSPKGAFIKMGHVQHEKDKYEYLGQEYHRIFYDQVERFTESQFTEINTTLRSTNPDIATQIFASANPGGVGHVWVKNKWLDRCAPTKRGERIFNESFQLEWQPMMAGDPYVDEWGESWEYHPALVFDNPQLMNNDPKYVRKLLALPYEQKEAYLWGNWDVFVGQYFQEFRREIHADHRIVKIPKTWDAYLAIDYATTGWFFMVVAVVDYDGNVWVVSEDYFLGKSLKYKARRTDRLVDKYNVKKIICPWDMWSMRGDRESEEAETIIERFKEYLETTVPVVKAPRDRIPRWDLIKEGLSWQDGDTPWLRFGFDDKGRGPKKLVETIPAQIHDENNPEDMSKEGWDHGVDALGYLVSVVKRKPRRVEKPDYEAPVRKKSKGKLSWLMR